MNFVSNVKSLPGSLVGMFLVFLCMPFVALQIHQPPWEMIHSSGIFKTALVGFTYWLSPLLLCTTILIRRHLFLPFYILQVVALVVHCAVFGFGLPFDLLMTRYTLIGCMGYIGLQFSNKDFLYPFLTKTRRLWRMARRIEINVPMEVIAHKGFRIPALMENCSITGVCIKIKAEDGEKCLKHRLKGDELTIAVKINNEEIQLNTRIVWFFDYGVSYTIGLRVVNTPDLMNFVSQYTAKDATVSPVSRRQSQLLEHDVRQTAFFLWMLFIALSFGMPAFA